MKALRHFALGVFILSCSTTVAGSDHAVDPRFQARDLSSLPNGVDPRIWSARSDGQRVAYVARENSAYVAIFDNERIGPYRQLQALPHDDLYFVASQYGRISRRGQNEYSATDGQVFLGSRHGVKGPYRKLVWMTFPETDDVIFKAQIRGKWFLHMPHHVSEPFDAIDGLHFVSKGRVLIARARIGERWFKLVDGKTGHPIDPKQDETLASSTGELLAYVAVVKGKRRAVLNGQLGHVLARDTVPLMSPDGKHIAYIATHSGEEFVVLDEQAFDARASAVLHLGWSRERRNPIYVTKTEKQYRLYVGNTLETHNDAEIDFGKSGQLIATLSSKRVGNNVSEWWQIGGNVDARELHDEEPALPIHISDHRILFSPNGKRWAYFAERLGDGLYLVVDGKPEKLAPDREIDRDSLVWSPDSAYAAYLVRKNHKTRVVQSAPASWLASRPGDWFGAREGEWFDELEDDRIQFARDDRLVYKARKGQKWYLVVGSRKSQGFDGVGPIILGPQGGAFSTGLKKGTEYALINHKTGSVVEEFDPLFGHSGDPIYLAQDDDKTFCVIGFFRQKRFDDIARTRMTLHPVDDAVAYAAREGEMWLVMSASKSNYRWDRVSTPLYSPDGRHLAYTAEIENKWYLVLDEKPIGPFDLVDVPVFSDDSRHVAFLARKGRALSWKVEKLYKEPTPKQVAQKAAATQPDA